MPPPPWWRRVWHAQTWRRVAACVATLYVLEITASSATRQMLAGTTDAPQRSNVYNSALVLRLVSTLIASPSPWDTSTFPGSHTQIVYVDVYATTHKLVLVPTSCAQEASTTDYLFDSAYLYP
ncbi:Aste57867_1863 [Aphanomyces stellatus]|uniref:Aste57867_1863 protein n=1 Tax=Aphanomyces stellatus TaxID=120398 RepID=A0A485K6B4_9STRA|nr:hypothetical protein As57867_001861 [Aphanomyces stellatus]VFT79070.1 Aste57867_1863 [Aphanomyces stellatus]